MNKIIKKIRRRIAYYMKRYYMPKAVAIELVLSDFRHYKTYALIENEIK